ncbi:MAG TPA: DUF177 domain-containing protein [Solirubrobacteraceae bacterium]|jgi:uncharacterized protein
MAATAHDFDLGALRLSSGEGRQLRLEVPIEPLLFAGEPYRAEPLADDAANVPVVLDVSRMMGGGYALRLCFSAALSGPCMRCLKAAEPTIDVDAREVDRRGEGEELESPYVHDEILDLAAWARDAFALAAPVKVLCREECAGLCPICAADLNEVGSDHIHETPPDPRWAKLRELKLE